MWGQLFGQRNEEGAPPGTAHGASATAATAASSSLAQNLGKDPRELAGRIEAIAADRVNAAWSTLGEEWKTQKLIWESVLLTRKNDESYQSKVASVRATLDNAIALGPHAGGAVLKQALQMNLSDGDVLANAVMSAVHEVIRQERMAPERSRLARELRSSSNGKSAANLEALVSQCELADLKLERDVRLALQLTMPAELGPKVTGARTSSKLGGAVTGAKTSSKLGAPVSKKTSSVRVQSTGTAVKAKPTASGRPALPDGLTSDLPQGAKAARAADKVRVAAEQKVKDAWQHFEEEVKVQKLVWQSVVQVQTMSKSNPTLVNQIEDVKSRLDLVITTRTVNAAEALRALRVLMKSDSEKKHLGNSLQIAAHNIFEQDGVVADRRRLADMLDEAAKPSFAPATGAARFELESLLGKCKLDDAQLERRIRQALQLPAPSSIELGGALGPAARPSQTWSQFSGVTSVWDTAPSDMKPVSKKSSSMRAQSAGSSTKVQKENKGASGTNFRPKERIVMEL